MAVAFAPDGSTLAAGDDAGTVRLVRLSDGVVVGKATLPDPTAQVTSLAFGPDGTHLAAGSTLPTTFLWAIASVP